MIDFVKDNWVELVGAIFGLLYIFYEYKASMRMWPIGILMSIFYIYVYIQHTFYAFAIINVYYIVIGIYGWIKWSRTTDEDDSARSIQQVPMKYVLPISIVTVLLFVVLSYILNTFTDSTVAYSDAIITTLSVVAMWMLAQKWAEQWLLLIVLNFISTIVYWSQDLYATTILYFIYFVGSILGYLKWRKLALNNEKTV